MTGFEWFLMAVLVGMFILTVLSNRTAYHNGVIDGYGYSKGSKGLGYKAAGEYLTNHMSHRWPELNGPVRFVFPVDVGMKVAACDCDAAPGDRDKVFVPPGNMVYVCGKCHGARICKT